MKITEKIKMAVMGLAAVATLGSAALIAPNANAAQDGYGAASKWTTGASAGSGSGQQTDLMTVLNIIINVALGVIGFVAVVMIIMGGIAISGANWAMYLFLLEVVAIMLFGLFMKDRLVRNAGIVGIFLAVLWFTKDLSFVWPIILGLGIIGTVVFILLSNGQKMPPQIPDKQ